MNDAVEVDCAQVGEGHDHQHDLQAHPRGVHRGGEAVEGLNDDVGLATSAAAAQPRPRRDKAVPRSRRGPGSGRCHLRPPPRRCGGTVRRSAFIAQARRPGLV